MTDPVSRAAVLVPVFATPDGLEIVLTLRADGLANHQGQVAFPGGRFDPQHDESLLATALREADEEIGLAPADVEILGALAEVQTLSSGFVITPFVGRIPAGYQFRPHAGEVAEVFTLPLRAYANAALRTVHSSTYQGTSYSVTAIRYRGWLVWGATLRIIDALVASPFLVTPTDLAGA